MAIETRQIFTPAVLDSYDRLRDYFAQSQTVPEIQCEAAIPAPSKPILSQRQIVEITHIRPFVKYYLYVVDAVRKFLFYAGLVSWSIQVGVHEKLWKRDRCLNTWETFGDRVLAFSINAAAKNSWDAYLQPKIPVAEMRSERMRELVNKRIHELHFYTLEEGYYYCRGMTEWWMYLYFRTKDFFSDPDAHIRAIGKRFENGAPSEAIVLHALCAVDRDFLKIRSEERQGLPMVRSLAVNSARVAQVLQSLEPGAYALGSNRHRTNLIVTGLHRGYFYDPDLGTFSLNGADDFAMVAKKLLRYVKPTVEKPDWFYYEKLSFEVE